MPTAERAAAASLEALREALAAPAPARPERRPADFVSGPLAAAASGPAAWTTLDAVLTTELAALTTDELGLEPELPDCPEGADELDDGAVGAATGAGA